MPTFYCVNVKGTDHFGRLNIGGIIKLGSKCVLRMWSEVLMNSCTAVSLNSYCYKVRFYVDLNIRLTFKGYLPDCLNCSLRKVR
jgi:hypothetical protein